MKKILLLFLGLSFCSTSFAQKGQQAFGLTIGSEVTSVPSRQTNEGMPTFSYSGGVYYDLNFSRRFGFNISPGQRIAEEEIIPVICIDCLWGLPSFNRYAIHTLEVPVNLTLNLDSKESVKWKTYFYAGYTYSYLYLIRNKDTGDILDLSDDFMWLDRNFHYANMGFEVRHNFGENFTLAINPTTRIQLDQEIGNLIFGLNFKIARIL